MYNPNGTWHRLRPAMTCLAILFLVSIPSLAAFASYSGDDPYDPAAGGLPEPTSSPALVSYSGRGPFAPPTSVQPEPSGTTAETCTGPDPYDPASGCHPERSLANLAPSKYGLMYDLFARFDAGLVDAAATEFADAAVVDDRLDGNAYLGSAQIAAMLQSWRDEGRHFNVLQESTVPVGPGVDVVSREVEISDNGLVRGQGTLIAIVYEGQIQNLTVTHMR